MNNSELSKKRRYDGVSPLGENDFLLRVSGDTGFLTKLNKDGSVPKALIAWRKGWGDPVPSLEELDIIIHRESFRQGWKLVSFRGGESQNWAILRHPIGFLVEVHVRNFIKLLQHTTIVNGELQGRFKWDYSQLISKEDE